MKLNIFNRINFLQAVKALFKELDIPINYVTDQPTTAQEILKDTYKDNSTFQLIDEVYFVGMVDDAAFDGYESLAPEKIQSDYDGILFFGVTLHQRERNLLPTRAQLAEIARAFNREYYYTPVVLVFKYEDDQEQYIAFANTERLKYKQSWREGEKAGKVSLLRDINIENPHHGHEDIINQLQIPTKGKHQVHNFNTLYNYWKEVFSVNILNKKFYQELQTWYFWAIKEVTFPNPPNRFDYASDKAFDEASKEHNGKNVIRLLTRILFVWFIKEKKLIPEEIFDEKTIADKLLKDFTPQKPHGIFATGKHNSKYYRAILQNLFFATLNREMGKREFRKEKAHHNITNLMRYESYFKDEKYFIQLMESTVPFMNGGLFECLDKPHPTKKGRQGGDIIIYQDGFSDRKDNKLVVPDYLFFDIDEDVDVSSDMGSKSKKFKNAKTRGLLQILKSYKFTITENTPIEEDVALDPELLGKVFENLLASYNPETKTTARKQTGSFYTPREIVNYMVDESLIAYLKNAVSDWEMPKETLDQQLHELFSFDNKNPFADEPLRQKQIIKALDKCKILDPACGSGAFPMGILQKMVHVLHKVDANNTEWKQRQIDKVKKAIESLEELDDERFRERSIKELKAQIKDIEEAFGYNELDYGRKLFLIENCIYGVDIQSIATQISKLRFFISLVVDQTIDRNKNNFGIRPLPNLETKFVAANTLIGIEKPQAQLNMFENKEITKLEKKLEKVRHKIYSAKTPRTKRKLREQDKKLCGQITTLLKNDGLGNEAAKRLAEWNPYDQNSSADFFDAKWMFGIKDGFDIVIGNPPYVFTRDVKFKGDFKKYIDKEYYSKIKREKKSRANQSGKINLFAVFILKGLFLCKKEGVLTYIIPNNILRTTTYNIIRKYILNNTHIDQIVDLGSGIFDKVTASTIILNLINTKSTVKSNIITNVEDISNFQFSNKKLNQEQFEKNVSYSFNIFMDEKSLLISDYIKKNSQELGLFCVEIIPGIDAPKSLITTFKTKTNLELVEGKSISRFWIRPVNKYIEWIPNRINRTRPNHVWAAQKKIITQRISGGSKPLVTSVDYTKKRTFNSVNNILLKSQYDNLYEFINIILNSDLINWYYANNFSNNSNLTVNISKTFLEVIPISKNYKDNNYTNLLTVFSFILNCCKQNNLYGFKNIFKVTNALVFNLYFPKHMKEREIDVIDYVKADLEKVLQGRDFEKLSLLDKEEVIEELHLSWTHLDNEVCNRIALFSVRSPEILKPILEST